MPENLTAAELAGIGRALLKIAKWACVAVFLLVFGAQLSNMWNEHHYGITRKLMCSVDDGRTWYAASTTTGYCDIPAAKESRKP